MRTVGIAVVGLGYWGPNLVRNFSALEDSPLRVVCDLDERRVAAAKRLHPAADGLSSFEALLARKDVDGIVIATPVDTHFRLARAALEAGKHVLVEKPFTSNSEQAEELIAVAQRRGLTLMVDHVFLYHPAVRRMKALIQNGELGELYFINSVRVNLGQFQHDVNVVWDLAPHDISIVDFLVDRPAKSVSAFGSAHKRSEIEDVAYLSLDFGGGLIAGLHVSWLSPVKIRSMMVGGSLKTVTFNDVDVVEKIRVYDTTVTVRENNLEDRRRVLWDYRAGDIWSPHLDSREALSEVAAHFVECVRGERQPITDGAAGLRVVRVLEAAQLSIRAQGGRITL